MIHTDGRPTIAMRESDTVLVSNDPTEIEYRGTIPPYDVPPCDEDPEENDDLIESELRKLDEMRADRDREIADRLTDDDVSLIFAGDFDIVPRRRPRADSFGNEVHTYNGHGDGFTVTADITVGVSGRAGGFTVDHLNEAIRRNIGGDIGPSFTIVQVRRNHDDLVVYEL